MKNSIILWVFAIFLSLGCSEDSLDVDNEVIEESEENENTSLYFPPTASPDWEMLTITELGWNENTEQSLRDYLEEKDTRAFIILKDGKIVVEWYFDDHTQNTSWYWASAGKTLTAFTVGLAQNDGFLDISDKTSNYLGAGWTSLTTEKEDLITIRHQLTMTSGMDDVEFDCVTPDCLNYVVDAGTRWAYHNGPYTLLQSVVANAAGQDWSDYFNAQLRNKIGMDGFWFSTNGKNNVYFSTARSMARFGLLNLNNGTWDGEEILSDMQYLETMTNTSQNLNKSYGYLWWLNGKENYRLPGSQVEFSGNLIPNAPADTYAGLGKNDQKLYVVPSENLVVVRMGENASDNPLASSSFDNELWGILSDLMNL